MIEKITKEMFAESVKTKFRIKTETPEPVELELVELTEGVSSSRHEQFSLIFHGPKNPFLPQMIYQMENEKLGELEIFLVPLGKIPDGFKYEAVFNRFLEGN